MRRFLICTLAGIALASCGTTQTADQIIAQIQAYTAKVCAFQPTAASVAAVVAALYPQAGIAVGIVEGVGNAICAAPTTKAAAPGGVATKIVSTPRGAVAVKGRRL